MKHHYENLFECAGLSDEEFSKKKSEIIQFHENIISHFGDSRNFFICCNKMSKSYF